MSGALKQVVLGRHGFSNTNKSDIYQSGDQFANDPLALKGERQAEWMAEAIARSGFRPEALLSSAYLRAAATAKPIAKYTGLDIVVPIETTDGGIVDSHLGSPDVAGRASLLRELDEPSELAGRAFKDPAATAIKEEINAHALAEGWHYSDEENRFDSWRRGARILGYLAQRPERRMVVVSHGGAIKAVIANVLFGDREDWTLEQKVDAYRSLFSSNTWVDNTAIFSLQYYEQEDRWQWIMGDNSHLGGAFGFMPEQQQQEVDVSVDKLQSSD